MEVVAADLSLLAMPFLLSKAANAATEFDARESPETAEAFVRACLDVKALFDHPELAGLNAVAAQLHPPPVIPPPSPKLTPAGTVEDRQASPEASASSYQGMPGGSPSGGRQMLSPSSSGFTTPPSSPTASMASASSELDRDGGLSSEWHQDILPAIADGFGSLSLGGREADEPATNGDDFELGDALGAGPTKQHPADEAGHRAPSHVPSSASSFASPSPSPAEAVCFDVREAESIGLTPNTRGMSARGDCAGVANGHASTPGLPPKRLSAALAQAITPGDSPPSRVPSECSSEQGFSSPASSMLQLSPEAASPSASHPSLPASPEQNCQSFGDEPGILPSGPAPSVGPAESHSYHTALGPGVVGATDGVDSGHRESPGSPAPAAACPDGTPSSSIALSLSSDGSPPGGRESPHHGRGGSRPGAVGVARRKSGQGSDSEVEGSPVVAQSTLRKAQRRAFDSDDDLGLSPAAFRAGALVAERPRTSASISQLLLDTLKTREVGSRWEPSGEPPIEVSSGSEDECMVQTGPRTKPRSRYATLLETDSEEEFMTTRARSSSPPPPQPPTELYTPQQRPSNTSAHPPNTPATYAAFKKRRGPLVLALLQEYNEKVFEGSLPKDLEVTWNVHLKTTAGLTHYKRDGYPARYSARVELSSKVVDSEDRLRATLLHELCHVAAWLVHHAAKPPHGPHFQFWADRATKAFPELEVSTCHTYDIHFPYRWQCTTPSCAKIIKRHSNSIDISKKVCGLCFGKLVFLGRFNQDGTPAAKRAPTGFSLFVKEHFSAMKQALPPGSPHAAVMQGLSAKWKESGKGKGGPRDPMQELNLSEAGQRMRNLQLPT